MHACRQHINRLGFTLVELSIVLVIIGLLIGGILAGQSLIESTKINAQVAQIQQFDAAVMAFKAKYKFLPGDAPAFGGNGNGAVALKCCGGSYISIFSYVGGSEIASFWGNLFPSSFPGSGSFLPPTTTGSSKNVPTAKMGKSNSFIIAEAYGPGASQSLSPPSNFYAILGSTQAQTQLYGDRYQFSTPDSTNSAATPLDALALENKMDDGNALTGNVLSGGLDGILTTNSSCNNLATGVYATTQTYVCTPLIRIGGSAGNPL